MFVPRRPLPGTDAQLTVLGLGAWAMGGVGWSGQDDERSLGAIARAAQLGVGWIDTAAVYGQGHAEAVVGRALRALREGDRPLVFTKGGLRVGSDGRVRRDLTPASLRAECEASLRRLGIERIDLYQLHWPPDDDTPVEPAWDALAQLLAEGKVRWLGASNFGVALLDRLEAVRHVDVVQPPLSLVRRGAAADVLPWCAGRAAGAIVYSPLQSGLLAGRLTADAVAALPADDWRPRRPEFREPELGRTLALVDRLRPIAAARGCSLIELAIAWTLAWPGVTGAIVGGRDAAQVDGWAGAGRIALGEPELDAIADALRETGAGEGPVRPPRASP